MAGANAHGDPLLTFTHSLGAPTSASVECSAANTERRYLWVQNMSTTEVWCKFGAAAVVNEGIELAPTGSAGDSFSISPSKGNLTTQALNVIGNSTGAKSVSVLSGS